jgi:predicted RNase H-like HicB family nuclease
MPEPLRIETEIEVDSRWIAEAVDLPGVLAYGSTREEAVAMARALATAVRDEMSGQSQ